MVYLVEICPKDFHIKYYEQNNGSERFKGGNKTVSRDFDKNVLYSLWNGYLREGVSKLNSTLIFISLYNLR